MSQELLSPNIEVSTIKISPAEIISDSVVKTETKTLSPYDPNNPILIMGRQELFLPEDLPQVAALIDSTVVVRPIKNKGRKNSQLNLNDPKVLHETMTTVASTRRAIVNLDIHTTRSVDEQKFMCEELRRKIGRAKSNPNKKITEADLQDYEFLKSIEEPLKVGQKPVHKSAGKAVLIADVTNKLLWGIYGIQESKPVSKMGKVVRTVGATTTATALLLAPAVAQDSNIEEGEGDWIKSQRETQAQINAQQNANALNSINLISVATNAINTSVENGILTRDQGTQLLDILIIDDAEILAHKLAHFNQTNALALRINPLTSEQGFFAAGPDLEESLDVIGDDQQDQSDDEGTGVDKAPMEVTPTPDNPVSLHTVSGFNVDRVTNTNLRNYLPEEDRQDPGYSIGLLPFNNTDEINTDALNGILSEEIISRAENFLQNQAIVEIINNYDGSKELVMTVDGELATFSLRLIDEQGRVFFVSTSSGEPNAPILVLPIEEGQSNQTQRLNPYLIEQLARYGITGGTEDTFALFGIEFRMENGVSVPYIVSVASTNNSYYRLSEAFPMFNQEAAPTEQSVEQIIENARMFEINGEPVGFDMVGTISTESVVSGTESSFIMPVVTSRPYDLPVTVNDEAGNPVTIETRVVNMAIPINGENVEFVVILGGNSLMPMVTTYDARAYLTEDTFTDVPMTTTRTYHMQFDSILNIGDQVKIQIWGATDISTATNTWFQLVNARGENTFINNAHLYADLFDDHNALVDAVDQQNANIYNNNANNPQRLVRVSTIGLNGSN